MAIDTNIGIIYNENFPVAGVDQSSQGFRDNFTVLKRALENLQSLKSSASSVLALTTTIGSGGEVRVTAAFPNNSFKLPEGSPSVTPVTGMIRHLANVAQFYDGTAWLSLISTDAQGGVRIPSRSYLKIPSGFSSERPTTGEDGMLRYNVTMGQVEVYRLGQWTEVGVGSSREINAEKATFSGNVSILTDATFDDHAVNRRSLRSFMAAAMVPKTKGVSAGFNFGSNTISLTAQPFTIALAGDVVGEAIVTDLRDTVIQTTIPKMLTLRDVRDEVGTFVKGTVRQINQNTTTETGITVNYDSTNNTLELGVREFDINLTGAVVGTGHSSRLGNVTINTTTDLIRGFMVADEGSPLGSEQSVRSLNFVGGGVVATQTNDAVTIEVAAGLTQKDIRDTVGDFVSGTVRQANTNAITETGIYVNYDALNNRLELSPRDFRITLAGAVTGNAVVSRLGDTTIVTQSRFIEGLTAFDEGYSLGLPETVKKIDVVGGGANAVQVGDRLTINVPAGLDRDAVRDTVSTFVRGTIRVANTNATTESGIFVNYDHENQTLEVYPRDFRIALTGAVTGSGTVSRLGNVSIATTSNFIKGITAFDEGLILGAEQSVRFINFVGGGVNATQVADSLFVNVPSPLSLSQVRDAVGGFITGTIRTANTNATTESGIFVNYDAQNATLELYPRDFRIALTGAVSGSGVVSRLGNVSIATVTTDLIKGLTAYDEGVALGGAETVRRVNFIGGGVTAAQVGDSLNVNVPSPIDLNDVRNAVGSFITGTIRTANTNATTESGIFVNYDAQNATLELYPRDFNITLNGAVSGTGRVTKLGNVSITTSTDLIRGLTVLDEGLTLGAVQSVQRINFTGGGVTTTQVGNSITVNVPSTLDVGDIRNTVGGFITGTIRDATTQNRTESGIFVNYDSQNATLEIYPREFTVALTGAVTGSAKISRLNNATITTTTDLLMGLSTFDEGIETGSAHTVREINFTGGGVTAIQQGNQLTVNVPATLDRTAVRDTVGSLISGTVRDAATQVSSESGISVRYDSENAVLELAPRDFTIALTGAVTGSARVSRLNNVSIVTSADFIRGVTLRSNGTLIGTNVKQFNVVGGNTTVSGDTATITVTSTVSEATIKQSVVNLLVGDQHHGLNARFDAANSEIDLNLKPIQINLQGAVRGNGTISFTGNSTTDGSVTINTEARQLGIEVRDEGTTAGNVRAVNFVGGGISTAVSIDGETATVFVPNSPGNEKFLLLDGGSANVPNSRRFRAGTGIVLNDGGPGGDFTISASSDAIIAKSRYLAEAELVGERSTINFSATGNIYPEVTDDPVNGRINVSFYSLNDGWYRPKRIDAGLITDKYGPSIDLGDLNRGIIETDADMGLLTAAA